MRPVILPLVLSLFLSSPHVFASLAKNSEQKSETSSHEENESKLQLKVLSDYIIDRASYAVAGILIHWFFYKYLRNHREGEDIVRLRRMVTRMGESLRNEEAKVANLEKFYKKGLIDEQQMFHTMYASMREDEGQLIHDKKRLLSELRSWKNYAIQQQLLASLQSDPTIQSLSETLNTYAHMNEKLKDELGKNTEEILSLHNELNDLTMKQQGY